MECVEQYLQLKLHIVVVGKRQYYIGKSEAVHFLRPAYTAYHCNISVGYEVHFLAVSRPMVIVLGYHQYVARIKFVLPIKDCISYSLVIQVGSLVGAAYYHGFIHTYFIVG